MIKFIPLIWFSFLIQGSLFSQELIEAGTCKIAALARYSSKGVELRWIPDNKTILNLSFQSGFSIERAVEGTDRFENLVNVKALNQSEWEKQIAPEKDSASKANLELAMDFLFANHSEKNEISLDKGIAELNEQKSKEDLVYAVFVLTAIKDAKVAKALGLGFLDTTVQQGKVYTYRIKLLTQSSLYKIEHGFVTI